MKPLDLTFVAVTSGGCIRKRCCTAIEWMPGRTVRSASIWRGDAAFPNMESFHLPQHGEAS